MRPERWALVKSAFFAVAEGPLEDRERLLAEACGDDHELRREVEKLLGADERSSRFPELAAAALLPDLEARPAAPMPERLGSYRLLKEIARGGMGTVYLAERADEAFSRQVAIKLIRRSLFSEEVLRRFQHERQILADFDHPAIARLLDGGTSPDGDPYIVMEYVEGCPIDEYCRRLELDTRARLELFRLVCAAVQYAHQRLVVHCDLKPGNILVTEGGAPKLLDFGIAKLLELHVGDEGDAQTVTHLRAMTPEYASPEQVGGRPISTASDVYSLGVVLYELLAGCLPYQLESRSPHELAAAVLEQEPERPSEALRRTSEGAAGARQVRHLRGDIDNIVLTALRKDPSRRYPSVERLDADLGRHLTGLPVTARRDTLGYRTGKLVRRHRVLTAASVLLFLSLAGGIGATWREARIANRRSEDVRHLANKLIFEFHDAILNLPGATAVREKLLQNALEYLDGLAHDARGDETLMRELATGYERIGDLQGRPGVASLGRFDAARQSFDRSLALRQRLVEQRPRDEAAAGELASSYLRCGHLEGDRGRPHEAIRDLEKAIAILSVISAHRPHDFPAGRDLGTAYMLLGDVLGGQHRPSLVDPARALEAYAKGSEIQKRLLSEDSKSGERRHFYASTLMRLSTVQGRLGHPREADESARAARQLLEGLQREYPDVTPIQGDLALLTVFDAERFAPIDRRAALNLLPPALATFDRIAAADPADASAAEYRAWAATMEGELSAPIDAARARRAYERGLTSLTPLLAQSPERARLVYTVARTHAGLAALLSGSDPRRARAEDEAAQALLTASRQRGNRDRRVPSLLFEVNERLARSSSRGS